MDVPTERVPQTTTPKFDDDALAAFSPLDPSESYDLHRAINERRASMENPEMLRRLRSL